MGGKASIGNIINQTKNLLLELSTKSKVKNKIGVTWARGQKKEKGASPLFPTPRLTLFIQQPLLAAFNWEQLAKEGGFQVPITECR